MYDFMEHFAPHLIRELVDQAFGADNRTQVETLFQDVNLPLR